MKVYVRSFKCIHLVLPWLNHYVVSVRFGLSIDVYGLALGINVRTNYQNVFVVVGHIWLTREKGSRVTWRLPRMEICSF